MIRTWSELVRVASHQRKTTKTSLRPGKSKDVVENVVKMKPFHVYKIILRPYHVLTTFTPRPRRVLSTSIRFPLSSYHALTTLTPFLVRSQHDQADHTTRLPRFQQILTAYSLLLLYRINIFTTTNTSIFNRMSFILIDRGK